MDLLFFLSAAAAAGIIHTFLGPDHYLPFVALAKARDWSVFKAVQVTVLCGIAHVFGAVLLGLAVIRLQVSIEKLGILELHRGDLAAWGLIAFGLMHLVASLRRRAKNRPEAQHLDTGLLFAIFILGPCEPLIPLMLYPGVSHHPAMLWVVIGTFGIATVTTMVGLVSSLTFGLNLLPLKIKPSHGYAITATVFLFCGLGIKFLGL